MSGGAESDLSRLFTLFWHPVATLEELRAAAPQPLAVTLLGRQLAVADLGPAGLAAVADRCLHRSARLSVGWVDEGTIRCGYHGWRWDAGGRCVEIPSMPDGPIPPKACLPAYDVEVAYGMVWVRLDGSAGTTIPACPAWDDAAMKVVAGAPYTWPVGAPRRVENFVDLAHFAWVHDGSLGRRDQPVPPIPSIRRRAGEMRFDYDPPDMQADDVALYGYSAYRVPMPLTVDIGFTLDPEPDGTPVRRHLWMTASPVDDATTRSFWVVARTDRHDEDDTPHLAFQDLVLAEDEPLVTNQDPPELHLDPAFEISVRTDRVSLEYRRWLRELVAAHAEGGPEAVATVLAAPRSIDAPTAPLPT
ncbi:aromatic ring-hydroxylating dioxygenase subunit alpha [Iamia sp. SCSIO 61187]|uniref:aromatic ring-hydroxylating oxygenase subunit alpha n=1 Tax=Iamia sp. SCSIO 61187 TaxID=2722752 RepID=UPI001C62C7DA|nr:aromatic ring-hydroxylating dioxygenase subunit alpha [Iamia sp. SCSIO 61187]QYG93152.1 aromatic ring-hydroxylating dioxygenase subunit alpha [Iamia sp. SCSIO 61187]